MNESIDNIEMLVLHVPVGEALKEMLHDDPEELALSVIQQHVIDDLRAKIDELELQCAETQLENKRLCVANRSNERMQSRLQGTLSLSKSDGANERKVAELIEQVDDLTIKLTKEAAQHDVTKQDLLATKAELGELSRETFISQSAYDKEIENATCERIELSQRLVSAIAEMEKLRASLETSENSKKALSEKFVSATREIQTLNDKLNRADVRSEEKYRKRLQEADVQIKSLLKQITEMQQSIDEQQPLISELHQSINNAKTQMVAREKDDKLRASMFAKSSLMINEDREIKARQSYVNSLMQRTLVAFSNRDFSVHLLSIYAHFLPKDKQKTEYPLFFFLHKNGSGQVLFLIDGKLQTTVEQDIHPDVTKHEKEIAAFISKYTAKEIEHALLDGSEQCKIDSKYAYLSEPALELMREVKDFVDIKPILDEEDKVAMELVIKHAAEHKTAAKRFAKNTKAVLKRRKG